ncbi:MAG: 30S ribosomal protein S17 [Bacteroidetes bacterium QH_10_64_37]|jgi:small subunit ribosomal protein S17|nr:MAG: 30S ribosomal protein S17 [Bacteroidetes bacterium QH_10_64_37]
MEQTEEHTEEQAEDVEAVEDQDRQAVERNDRKERIGVVESAKMDKSITVSVRRRMKHPMYGKYMKRSSTFMAHDEEDEARAGDTVRVMETRPISKNKRWRLVDIIERAK